MKLGAVIGGIATIVAALAVIIFLQSGRDDGRPGVGVGVKKAEAKGCDKSSHECLPKVVFVDVDGQAITPEVLEGKIVMVNFWATWCKPCQKEIPELTAAYKKYKARGFELMGVMTDDVNNEEIERFAKRYHLEYPVVRADYEIVDAFQPPANIPSTYLYDQSGRLVRTKIGALHQSELDQWITDLLDKK